MAINPFSQQAPIPGIQHVIVVGSGKGGVGKSTVAVNLALALKKQGLKVGLLDADIYGPSIPRMLGVAGHKPEINEQKKMIPVSRLGLKLMSIGFMVDEASAVVWRGPMLFKAMEQFFRDVAWGELDALIVDLPPGTGDVALTVAQKVPISGAITVCTPQNIALIDAKKALDMFERINVPCLGVVENMSYMLDASGAKVQLFPKGDMNAFLDSKGIAKLAEIPFHPSVGIASEAGVPILEADPQSPEAQAFMNLAKEVQSRLVPR